MEGGVNFIRRRILSGQGTKEILVKIWYAATLSALLTSTYLWQKAKISLPHYRSEDRCPTWHRLSSWTLYSATFALISLRFTTPPEKKGTALAMQKTKYQHSKSCLVILAAMPGLVISTKGFFAGHTPWDARVERLIAHTIQPPLRLVLLGIQRSLDIDLMPRSRFACIEPNLYEALSFPTPDKIPHVVCPPKELHEGKAKQWVLNCLKTLWDLCQPDKTCKGMLRNAHAPRGSSRASCITWNFRAMQTLNEDRWNRHWCILKKQIIQNASKQTYRGGASQA